MLQLGKLFLRARDLFTRARDLFMGVREFFVRVRGQDMARIGLLRSIHWRSVGRQADLR